MEGLNEEDFAAALVAGMRLEFVMFEYYDKLLPKMKDSAAKRNIANIRLQELQHMEITDNVLQGVVSVPPMVAAQVTLPGPSQLRILAQDMRPHNILSMAIPDALRHCYSIEKNYETAYSEIFSAVRDATTKARLMVMVTESKAHADTIARILEAMGEHVRV